MSVEETNSVESEKAKILYPFGNVVKSDMFEVTPEDYDENEDEPNNVEEVSIDIEDLKQKAIDDGYGETVINEALNLVDSSTKTYKDFETLISKALNNIKDEEREKAAKKQRLQDSMQLELNRLRKINDIAVHADNLIVNTYNTTAVIALNIIHRATEEQLQLDVYECPMYSVILQINKPWVSDIVTSILADWETQDYPKKFVENYLRGLGVPEDKWENNKRDLLKILPDNIRNEKSPDIYKQFKAVHIILQRNNPDEEVDLSDKIFSQTDQCIEYHANLEKAMEDGVPALAASAMATEAAIESMDEESKKKISSVGIAGAAGAFCGKVIGFKYRAAKSFDDMLRENVGEYGDIWSANREAVRKRKEELKEKKAELKHEEKLAKIEAKSNERIAKKTYVPAYDARQVYSNRNNGYNTNRYSRGYSQPVHRDFRPNIPVPIIVGAIHLILSLILWLILGSKSSFLIVGLVVAFIGFLKKEHNEKGAILTIVGGYALFLLAILL